MGRVWTGIGAVVVLLEAGDPSRAQEATSELTEKERQEFEEGIPFLVDGSTTPNKFGLGVAMRYGSRAIPHLVRHMKENEKAREGCATALLVLASCRGELGESAGKALIEVAKEGGPRAVVAAWALGSTCEESAVDVLAGLAAKGNKYEAVPGCFALGMIGGDKAKEVLLRVQSDTSRPKEALLAAGHALDLIQKWALSDRKSVLITLMRTTGGYGLDTYGWLGTPPYIGIRKAMQWQMKELIPDLRSLVREFLARDKADLDMHDLATRLVYAIYKLGGETTEEERATLRERGFID